MKISTKAITALTATLFLSACSVTTKPYSRQEFSELFEADKQSIVESQPAITAPISLEEAMARAIKFNLQHRLVAMEEAVAAHDLDAAQKGLLPSLVLNAGYSHQSEPVAQKSQIVDGSVSNNYSFSRDQNLTTADLTMSWNILDFGVGYYQAKQQADRHFIAQERKRRVVQNLMMQVRTAYWRAAAAERMQAKIERSIDNAEYALQQLQTAQNERLGEPVENLQNQKALLETIAALSRLRNDLSKAKPELAALMNLTPGTPFTLDLSEQALDRQPELKMDIERMEALALAHNPEIREAAYEARISLQETRKQFARMFPGLSLSAGPTYTSNSFNQSSSWSEAGLQVTWNLLGLFSTHSRVKSAEVQEVVAETQRKALALATLTQLHLAVQDLQAASHQFDYARKLWQVDQELTRHAQNSEAARVNSAVQRLRSEIGSVQSELNFYESYAEMQNSLARTYASIGIDPLGNKTLADDDLETVKAALADNMQAWMSGEMLTAAEQ